MRRSFLIGSIALGAAFAAAPALAQTWPAGPVKIVVPQPPGGGFDTVARLLAERLGPALGQTVIVENRPGAGTLVGTESVARAPADGYTLLLGALSNIALNPGFYPKLSYDPLKDFVPVGLAVSYSYTLVARNDLPWATLPDLIAHAKKNPDSITYASAGNGSGQHIAAAVTTTLAGAKLTHVPYRGAQAAYQDLIAGRVDVFFDISTTAKVQIAAGRVKPLAVSSKERQPFHPDVPSVAETGVAPLEMESWFGIFAPSATPPAALAKLREAFAEAMRNPELIERFRNNGGKPLAMSTAETEAFVKSEVERWTRLVRQAGIQAQ
ncbi:tripartite tricarboxylate transporter substrate binding protein [Burkholderiaceae bacterium FT117]|uniref:Bug family tripartite tricarboxylate transporter substrate binding protein n=1 Tax=Zeimonas sediminis TaxID=2944268 RepID=UPI0023430028|nr:tripartite tricarboxylate transporter substrate binding protein [Zeimonas sediminis]MCM5569590.1 tripartite tricarboxylate transporter substrate binding protein [Zeimonas sediminis]